MPPSDIKTNSEADKREAARRALEGAEWTEKRAEQEKLRTAKEQSAALEKRLGEIRAEKEKLELAWIDLDEKRKAIRAILLPIMDEEKKIEEEEAKLEAEESATGVPESRHEVEAKRWPIQDQRKAIEQKKWVEEEKVVAIDKVIEANTKKYRTLLEEEDRQMAELDKLKAALAPAEEPANG